MGIFIALAKSAYFIFTNFLLRKKGVWQWDYPLEVNFLLDFIVTRNTNNFKKSILSVMTPEEAISFLESSIIW